MLALLEARANAERDAPAEHAHAPYLATMPPRIPLLRDWSAAQLARLQSAALTAAVRSQQDWVERTFAYVLPFTPWRDGLDAAAREQLEWAERVVRSRALASTTPQQLWSCTMIPAVEAARASLQATRRLPYGRPLHREQPGRQRPVQCWMLCLCATGSRSCPASCASAATLRRGSFVNWGSLRFSKQLQWSNSY